MSSGNSFIWYGQLARTAPTLFNGLCFAACAAIFAVLVGFSINYLFTELDRTYKYMCISLSPCMFSSVQPQAVHEKGTAC